MINVLKYDSIVGEEGELLKKHFVTPFRSGHITVNDITMPEYFQKFGDRIQNMQVNNSDIWVCSFPKTGTTWTQEMVWCIANEVNLEKAKELLEVRFPFLEHSPLFDYRRILKQYPELKPPDYVLDSVLYVENCSQPRFIKTHLPWCLLPKEIQNGSKKPKIIYVTRNPKDTLVSYFHHCHLMEGYKGTFEDFINLFMNGKVCFAPFWNHVLEFWKRRNDTNILFIRYEDMKSNLSSVISQVSTFLNKKLSIDDINKLLKHLTFESMKNNKAVNYEHAIEMTHKYNLLDSKGTFMRAGQNGGYKTLMSLDTIKKIDTWTEKHLNSTGLSFT